MNIKAIYSIYPNIVKTKENANGIYVGYDADGNEITIDWTLVEAWINPDQYKKDRQAEYPSIGEQLDMIFHSGLLDGSDWATTIQAVKDKYPKE